MKGQKPEDARGAGMGGEADDGGGS